MNTGERLIRWLATLLPQKIGEAPERVLINFACVLIGLSALLAERPRSLLAVWPTVLVVVWASTMLLGGAAALTGYWNNPARRWANSLERTGYLAILLAALVYGVGIIVAFGWQGVPSGVVFLGIAFAKSLRLLITSAYRTYLLTNGEGPGVAS